MLTLLIRLALLTLLSINTAIAAEDKSTILVMGDSLSAGYGINPTQGWVYLLNEPLKKYPHWKIVNASVSGETTSGGMARLTALLTEHRPKIVVIELGANDGLRGQPISMMKKNLQLMIDAATKNSAKILLVGMQIPTNYGSRYSREFKESYPQLAEQNKVHLVPFLLEGMATNPELFQKDGLHPTAEAQPILMNNVFIILKNLL